MQQHLEDELPDILDKAQRGLGLGHRALAEATTATTADLQRLRAGQIDSALLHRAARVLRLAPACLEAIARGRYHPEAEPPEGLRIFSVPFGPYSVNLFLLFDPESRDGILFDTGTTAGTALAWARENSITLQAAALTHTHRDHVGDLDRVREAMGPEAPLYVPAREPIQGSRPLGPGDTFTVAGLVTSVRLTPGHSSGGLTYVIEGLERPVAIVGDALFAGSVGGIPAPLYTEGLAAIGDQILSLPDETILCPGHGPMTTVGQEKENNPFFARS